MLLGAYPLRYNVSLAGHFMLLFKTLATYHISNNFKNVITGGDESKKWEGEAYELSNQGNALILDLKSVSKMNYPPQFNWKRL